MKIFRYVENNKKIVKNTTIALLFIPVIIQLFFSSLPLIQRLGFAFLLPILSFILGFVGIYFVLGIHVLLKLVPKKYLNIANNFFIIMGVIGLILYIPTVISFINSIDEALMLSVIYVNFGVVIGAYRIKIKYKIE